jgi:hypothetical protein
LTNVVYLPRRKYLASYAASMTVARFTGRMGRDRTSFERGVYFKITTNDGSGEFWCCVIRSPIVRPLLASFEAGDPVSVCGVRTMRPVDVAGATRIAHSVFCIEACPRTFPQGLRLW